MWKPLDENMGVPRSREYMFAAYFDARLRPKARDISSILKTEFGFKTLKDYYNHVFNSISNEHERYNEAYGDEASDKYYSSITKTVQEYWGGKIPMPPGINRPLYDRWNHQHDWIHDQWVNASPEELWIELKRILEEDRIIESEIEALIERPNYAKRTVSIRRGQKKFRDKLLVLYGKCMVTGCSDRKVLEASHIVPYSQSHDNSPENGLLLRSDIHVLFDEHLLEINKRFILSVSDTLTHETYIDLNGMKIEFNPRLNIERIKENLEKINF
tara:strand:- start:601 stop:1416 length:816 start_codon:yes stop_codon:yes gene_type:complete